MFYIGLIGGPRLLVNGGTPKVLSLFLLTSGLKRSVCFLVCAFFGYVVLLTTTCPRAGLAGGPRVF